MALSSIFVNLDMPHCMTFYYVVIMLVYSAVSSKAKLLQQIEQLTTVKNELTSEVLINEVYGTFQY